jgi:hypothetical protein
MISTVLSAVGGFIGDVVAFFTGLGPKIVAACSGFSSILISAGKALMDGLLNGIKAGAQAVFDFVSGIAGKIADLKGPLPYDKKVLIPNGMALMEGLEKGIETGAEDVYSTVKQIAKAIMEAMKEVFGISFDVKGSPVQGATSGLGALETQMKATSGAAVDLRQSMGQVVPSPGLGAADKKMLDQQLLELEMERKQLELQKSQAGANQAAIKARLEEIKQQKLQLGLQKDQLNYASKYGEATDDSAKRYDDMLKTAQDIPTNFAKSTGQQFLSDVGISGQGAVPQLLEQGAKYIFQVANMDTALSAQQTLQRRQGQARVGR